MRILFYVLLQHSVWIRMISMAKMLPGTYNTRQRTQKYRWCSRFDGALLPTSFEQIKHRALLRTFPSPTPRRNNCQYQVLPSLSTTHLSPTMVEGSTSSSPPRASDADDGVLDGSPPSARSMVSLVGDRRCSVDVLAWSTLFAVEISPRVDDMDDRCCCGTLLIGRWCHGTRQVYDWTTAVMQGG